MSKFIPEPGCPDDIAPACPDPALPEGDGIIGLERCTAAGPVTVIGRLTGPDNTACPPVLGGVWEQIGWIDDAGLYTAGAWPVLVPCAAQSGDDYEVACASTDGRLLLIKIDSVGTVTVTNIDGTAIADGATPVKCAGADYEIVDACWTDDVTQVTRLVILAVPAGTVAGTVWIDEAGTVIPAPVGFHLCDQTRRMVSSEQWCVTVPATEDTCTTTEQVFAINVTESNLVSGAPGGPYVVENVCATPADADAMIEAWFAAVGPGCRSREDIAGVPIAFWFHANSMTSLTRVDPVTVRIGLDFTVPVPALPAPCVDDPAADFAGTAAILSGSYDAAGNGGNLAGAASFTFTVTCYTGTLAGPAQNANVERRKWQEVDGTIVVEDWQVDSTTGAETPFVAPVNGAWSQGACDGTLGACEGTPVETTVVQPATGTAFMGWLSVPINSTLADAIECSAVGGTAADAIVIDGITRDYVSIGMLRAVATILDGEQFDSLDWDDIFTSPFSPPIVWTLGTDPTGSIAASDLENWIATSILGRGVSFCAVKVTPEVSGSQCQFRVEIYGVPSGGPLPLYLVSPTHLTSEFQFLPQTAYAELDAQIPIAAPSGCELAGTTASVTIAGTFPVGEEIYLGALIDNAGTPVFLNGATPYESVIGTGAPQVATFTFNLTDIDWTSGTPYALTAADLAGLTAWTWFGTLSAPGLAFEVDGFEGAATFACPTPGEPAVRTVICDEQLDALATQIINGLTPAPGRIFQPHMVELTGGGYSTVNLSGVRSYSLLVLAGSVQILPPLEAPITLEIGESVQFEVDNPDRFDPSLSISSQGLTVDAKWHVSWEVTP